MTCANYNIIKEGCVSNSAYATKVLSASELSSLYTEGTTLTISAGQQIGLIIEFDEVYDVCYLDYYTDESLSTNIGIVYEGNSGEVTSFFTLVSPGLYRATINDYASKLTLLHLASSGTAILGNIEVIAEKNETIGFGSPTSEIGLLEVKHATKGKLSAQTTTIPVFNTNSTAQSVNLAVAPTLAKEDQFVFLSTSEEGPYLGIDDHGFQQPDSDTMQLVDDDFMSGSFPEQWVNVSNYKKGEYTSSEQGLTITKEPTSTGSSDIDNNLSHRGILTKDYFTPQSFTADVDIRFLDNIDSGVNDSTGNKGFFFALTNSLYLDDVVRVGYSQSDGRVGHSIGALSVLQVNINQPLVVADNYGPSFAHLDGKANDSYYSSTDDHRKDWAARTVQGSNTSNVAYGSSKNGDPFSELDNVFYEGNSFGDFTAAANWHTWRMVYDHTSQELSVYSNKVLLGSAVYKAEAFKGGCKLWIGGWYQNGFTIQLRNFKIRYDKLYKQKNVALSSNGGVVSATVSGITTNTSLLNDGLDSTIYIGPHPDANTKVRVTFDNTYDVVGYVLQQNETDVNTAPDRFGVTGWRTDLAIAAQSNYGDKLSYLNTYKGSPATGDVLPSRRNPTYVTSPTTASGITFVELSFLNYDVSGFANNALILTSLDVYAEMWEDVTVFPLEANPNKVKWTAGRWRNIKQSGTTNSLVMQDPRHNEVAFYTVPEYLSNGVDYGYSSAINSVGFQLEEFYDYTELVFSYPAVNSSSAGKNKTWTSAVQEIGKDFTLWRKFTEEVEVSVIFVYSTDRVVKEFKCQYLKEGLDPNFDSSWSDIPPMSIPHTTNPTADNIDAELRYGQYKQYKIDNNDGEFYTNNHLMPDALVTDPGGIGSFSLGERPQSNFVTYVLEDKLPGSYPSTRGLDLSNASTERLSQSLVLELDTPIKTRGVRIVVKNPVITTLSQTSSSVYSVEGFRVWSANTPSSYTSPVFDTGGTSNTERVAVETDKVSNTSTKVFVRSSDVKPETKYNASFEVWSSQGDLGTPQFDVVLQESGSAASTRTRAVSVGDLTHFIGNLYPYVYNHVTDKWSQPNGLYPGQGTGVSTSFETADLGEGAASATVPGSLVQERVALIGNVIYVAAEASNTGGLRIITLDLSTEDAKWEVEGVTRPLVTLESTMCAVGRKLYFFSESGPIFSWDIDTHVWELLDVEVPLATVGTQRDRLSCTLFNNKVYLFGDSNSGDDQSAHELSIFDVETETFTSGASSPKAMLTVQPFVVDNTIYVLSAEVRGSDQRYYPTEDRWEVFSSLRHTTATSALPTNRRFYFYRQGYIYLYTGVSSRQVYRALLSKNSWNHGDYPDLRDEYWGKGAETNLSWSPLADNSELMSQKRYLQLKVEMFSHDKVSSPILNKLKIVTPQELVIPASGTANVYLKVSGTSESTYHLWYTGKGRNTSFVSDYTLLHSVSDTTEGWRQPTIASGTSIISSVNPSNITAVRSPWVLPSTTSSGTYDVWFSLSHSISTLASTTETHWQESDIYYVNTSNPDDISENQLSTSVVQGISLSSYALLHPCVIAHSSTDFKMWYTARDAVVFGSGVKLEVGRIKFAESTDKYTWTSQQNVIGPGQDNVNQYDAYSVFRPCVLFENGMYRMWYTAQDGADGTGTDRIVYRESTDGVSWSALQLSIDVSSHGSYDSQGCSNPHVILDSDTYYIFYVGTNGTVPVIIRAESPDGLDWFNFKVIMSGHGIDGALDSNGIADFFVMIERDDALVGDVVTSTKLKLHNSGIVT